MGGRRIYGLWFASLIFDLLWQTRPLPSFARASALCLAAGLLLAFLDLPATLRGVSLLPIGTPARKVGAASLGIHFGVLLLTVANFFGRQDDAGILPSQVPRFCLMLSGAALVGLTLVGILGGMLLYDQRITTLPAPKPVPRTGKGDRDGA